MGGLFITLAEHEHEVNENIDNETKVMKQNFPFGKKAHEIAYEIFVLIVSPRLRYLVCYRRLFVNVISNSILIDTDNRW